MVKVYYWHPNTSDKVVFKKDKNDYGHLAISAEHDGQIAYLSLYPHTNLPLGSLIIPWIYVNADFKSYEEDINIMESQPDYIIDINNLDSKKVYNHILSLEEKWSVYNLYYKNCSNVVFDALMKCSKAKEFSIKYFVFKFYEKAMKEEKKKLQKSLHGHGKIFYRLFERMGFVTPYRVLSFAKFITTLENVGRNK